MNAFRSRATSQSGQAAVEMALLAPILIFVLLAIIDVGRAMYFYIGVGEAARAGAQYGAQSLTTAPDTNGMINAAKADAPQGITMNTPTATETCLCADDTKLKCGPPMTTQAGGTLPANCDPRVYVRVQTSATYKTLFNYNLLTAGVLYIVPTSFTLTGNSQMRAE